MNGFWKPKYYHYYTENIYSTNLDNDFSKKL